MHFTEFDVQPRDNLWEGAAELCKGCVIVAYCDVAFREFKFIYQHQDISAEKTLRKTETEV